MAIHIELIACKDISDQARQALRSAQCPIHKDVPGIEELEIVELQYGDNNDRTGLLVWGIPREIEIRISWTVLSIQLGLQDQRL